VAENILMVAVLKRDIDVEVLYRQTDIERDRQI
jgi:hypothetical protein